MVGPSQSTPQSPNQRLVRLLQRLADQAVLDADEAQLLRQHADQLATPEQQLAPPNQVANPTLAPKESLLDQAEILALEAQARGLPPCPDDIQAFIETLAHKAVPQSVVMAVALRLDPGSADFIQNQASAIAIIHGWVMQSYRQSMRLQHIAKASRR